MFTRRFLNLLQGRLALTKRDVWALELASNCEGAGVLSGLAGCREASHDRLSQASGVPP